MARGGYYIEVQGIDKLIEALKGTANGIKDLTALNRRIAERAKVDVREHTPVYFGQWSAARPSKVRRGGFGRLPAGFLEASVASGGNRTTAWVRAGPAPYIYVQEFGGHSYWHGGPAGMMRDRAHSKVQEFGKGMIRVGHYATKGHIIYGKPRKPLGYFIWNEAYHLREFIGHTYAEGIEEIGDKNGLKIDMAPNAGLDIKPTPKP